MKKLIAMVLCVLMIASMSVTAFATDVEDSKITGGKTGNVDVQVTDKDGKPIENTGTYKVTITWGNLLFKIKVDDATNDVKWDGSKYTLTNAAWDHTSADVTVKNESDMRIKVKGLFNNSTTSSETVDGVAATITGSEQTLDSAAGADAQADLVAEYVVALTNQTPPATVTELNFTVDTVNLTIQTTN